MENGIKVLVVDDVASTREDIRRLLYFEEDIKIIGEAEDGNEAVSMAEELRPDVILMDINLPEVDGITATEVLMDKVPESAVIIISIQGEQDYIRKAMSAGASDYLVKPFTSSELAETIRRTNDKHKKRQHLLGMQIKNRNRRQGKIITIFGTKGGIGKTMVACNLAAALSQEGKKVALIDLSVLGGDIPLMLNIKPKRNITDLAEEGIDDTTILDHFLMSHPSGVKTLCSPTLPEEAELLTPEIMDDIGRLFAERFKYTVIDTPGYHCPVTKHALRIADEIILLLTPDLISIKHARDDLDYLMEEGHADKVSLVLNRVGIENAIKTAELERALNSKFMALIPNDDKTAITSINKGVPFVLTHNNSRLTEAIKSIAKHFLEPRKATAVNNSKHSLLSRLFTF
ncbi:MAG: response regulator [Peptococcaceae bacterium]|nr:response regulator [Peptococcaceae bacterium]